MSKIDDLIATVRWCIDRSLDPMIKNKLQEAVDKATATPAPLTQQVGLPLPRTAAERLQSLLNVIPYPGIHVHIDYESYQLLTELHAHFAACDDMLKKGEELCRN